MKTLLVLTTAVSLLDGAFAVPNVTVVPLGSSDCRHWPSYLYERVADTTASLQFQIDQADDPGVNELVAISRTMKWGAEVLTMDLRKSRAIAKPYYRCFDSKMSEGVGLNPPVIRVAKDVRNAYLLYGGSEDGYKVEPYAHEVNGTRLPGVFLGALNRTTWGFRWVWPKDTDCGQLDYYEVKLQGLPVDPNTEPRAGYDPEFFGFLKVVPY